MNACTDAPELGAGRAAGDRSPELGATTSDEPSPPEVAWVQRQPDGRLAACFRVAGEEHVLHGLSGHDLLQRPQEIAGRLLERGAPWPWISPAEWEGLVASAFPAVADADDLEVEVLERQVGRLDVRFRGGGCELELSLRGRDLVRQSRVRSLLAERLLFVPRCSASQWGERVQGRGPGAGALEARVLHLLRTAPRRALTGPSCDLAACRHLEAGGSVEAGETVLLARGALLSSLQAEAPELDPHRVARLARRLGGRQRRVGPRSSRVRVWEFPLASLSSEGGQAFASGPAPEGELPNEGAVPAQVQSARRADTASNPLEENEIAEGRCPPPRGHDKAPTESNASPEAGRGTRAIRNVVGSASAPEEGELPSEAAVSERARGRTRGHEPISLEANEMAEESSGGRKRRRVVLATPKLVLDGTVEAKGGHGHGISGRASEAVRAHYGRPAALLPALVDVAPASADVDRLWRVLELTSALPVLLCGTRGEAGVRKVLADAPEGPSLVLGDALWLREVGSIREFASSPVTAGVLVALLVGVSEVLVADEHDLRDVEARALGARVKPVRQEGTPVAQGASTWEVGQCATLRPCWTTSIPRAAATAWTTPTPWFDRGGPQPSPSWAPEEHAALHGRGGARPSEAPPARRAVSGPAFGTDESAIERRVP